MWLNLKMNLRSNMNDNVRQLTSQLVYWIWSISIFSLLACVLLDSFHFPSLNSPWKQDQVPIDGSYFQRVKMAIASNNGGSIVIVQQWQMWQLTMVFDMASTVIGDSSDDWW